MQFVMKKKKIHFNYFSGIFPIKPSNSSITNYFLNQAMYAVFFCVSLGCQIDNKKKKLKSWNTDKAHWCIILLAFSKIQTVCDSSLIFFLSSFFFLLSCRKNSSSSCRLAGGIWQVQYLSG